MSLRFLTILTILTLCTIFTLPAFSEGHLSATYTRNPIDAQIGVSGDYERDFGKWSLETDGTLQSGDITESGANLAVAFDVGPIQVKPFTTLNAVRTSDWGHTLDGGLKLNVPIGSLDVAAGIFGRSSQAFVPLQTGTRNPVTGEVKWDDATLLSFSDLGVLNALIEAQFSWSRLDVGFTGIFDISNQRFHQLITDATASWDIPFQNLQFSVVGQHIAQAGDAGGQQFNLSSAIGLKF